MRTETITKNWYQFDELPGDVKEKAIEKLYDINVDHKWWDFIYEDAREVGLEIAGFDTDRGSYVDGNLLFSVGEICERIIAGHGAQTSTYELAIDYYSRKHSKRPYTEDEFAQQLKENYLSILQNEYEYSTSKESIIETIKANEYEFDSEGNL